MCSSVSHPSSFVNKMASEKNHLPLQKDPMLSIRPSRARTQGLEPRSPFRATAVFRTALLPIRVNPQHKTPYYRGLESNQRSSDCVRCTIPLCYLGGIAARVLTFGARFELADRFPGLCLSRTPV